MSENMSEKTASPLNNPLSEKSGGKLTLKCPFCSWATQSSKAFEVHLNRYHEGVVAAGGKGVRGEGGDLNQRIQASLLRHGYVKCPRLTVPCPTKENPLMARTCKHMNDCPERR